MAGNNVVVEPIEGFTRGPGKHVSFLRANFRTLAILSVMAWCGFQYGIDNSTISGMQAMKGFCDVFGYPDAAVALGCNLTPLTQQLISSLMLLGAMLGSLGANLLTQPFGRKAGIWAALLLTFLAVSVMIGSTSVGALYFARLVIGLANGLFFTSSYSYLSETAPAHCRGVSLVMWQMMVSLGQLIGSVVDNFSKASNNRASYQIPLGVIYIVPFCMCFVLPFMPESPRWYLVNNRDLDAARSLRKLYGSKKSQADIDQEIAYIKQGIHAELELQKGILFFDCFRRTDLRRTLLTIAITSFQAASGILYVSIYGTYFFELSNLENAFTNQIILGCIGLSGTILSLFLNRYFGRRTLMMSASFVAGCSMLAMGSTGTQPATNVAAQKVLVGFACIYIWSFNWGLSPIIAVASSEIPCQRLRTMTLGIGLGVGFVLGWLTLFTIPYFVNPAGSAYIGQKFSFIWGCSLLTVCLFVIFFVPVRDAFPFIWFYLQMT